MILMTIGTIRLSIEEYEDGVEVSIPYALMTFCPILNIIVGIYTTLWVINYLFRKNRLTRIFKLHKYNLKKDWNKSK